MKKILFLLMFFTGTLKAQTFRITGRVKAPAITIKLFRSPDSVLMKVAVSDTAGNFAFPGISKGGYYLFCSGIGFETYKSSVFLLQADIALPAIYLQPNVNQLASVSIVGKKQLIEVMPDKTVFNVQKSLSATGLNALDVLRKAPGVMLDNQNNLILESKAGVSIFIDGKRSFLSGDDLTNYLKTLQSADIATLEIITQPSARYDAAGNAGIINIRLVKNKSFGTNGSVLLGYGRGRYGKYNSSVTVNTRTNKLNTFTSYSNSFNKNRTYLNFDRFQNGLEYDQRSFDIITDHNHNIRAGLDYSPDKSSTLGIVINGIFRGSDDLDYARTPISLDGLTQQVLIANGHTGLRNKNLSGNLNYHYLDQKQHELTVDADYGSFSSNRDQTQPNAYYNSEETLLQSQTVYHMITPVNIHLLAFKTDYNQLLGKVKLAGGLKVSRVKTDNIFDFFSAGMYSQERSNVFDYTENINAAYFNLSQSWKKVSAQVGLRAEQTISNGELTSMQQDNNNIVKRNYINLFPSAGITYTLNPKDNATLSYSRRVDRPDYRSLNPFERNIDELSFSKGNPFLKPQYTDAIKLSNTYNYTLTTSLTYSYISNFFAQITDILDQERNFISPQNIANQQVINLGISYPYSIKKWWSVYANLNAFRSIYRSANSKFVAINQNTLSVYASNSFSLPKGYSAEVSGWYSSPSIWSGSYKTSSLGSLDVALQKSFAQNRLSVRMAASDVLYTSNWSGNTQYGALYIKGSGGYESRQLRVTLKYNLGGANVKTPISRQSSVEDEKSRIKS
jgi:iron complex outermembrane receptor protein